MPAALPIGVMKSRRGRFNRAENSRATKQFVIEKFTQFIRNILMHLSLATDEFVKEGSSLILKNPHFLTAKHTRIVTCLLNKIKMPFLSKKKSTLCGRKSVESFQTNEIAFSEKFP